MIGSRYYRPSEDQLSEVIERTKSIYAVMNEIMTPDGRFLGEWPDREISTLEEFLRYLPYRWFIIDADKYEISLNWNSEQTLYRIRKLGDPIDNYVTAELPQPIASAFGSILGEDFSSYQLDTPYKLRSWIAYGGAIHTLEKELEVMERRQKLVDEFSPSKNEQEEFVHSIGFHNCRLLSESGKYEDYELSHGQAQIVGILLREHMRGIKQVSKYDIMIELDRPGGEFSNIVRRDNPIWKKLIVSGAKRGTVRLNLSRSHSCIHCLGDV